MGFWLSAGQTVCRDIQRRCGDCFPDIRFRFFLFINKMDQPGTDRETLLAEVKEKLDINCVDFSVNQTGEDWKEQVAVCDEQVMEAYLEGEEISRAQIQKMIRERKLFPCYFGSALKMTGVEEFLDDLKTPDPGDFLSGNVWSKNL